MKINKELFKPIKHIDADDGSVIYTDLLDSILSEVFFNHCCATSEDRENHNMCIAEEDIRKFSEELLRKVTV